MELATHTRAMNGTRAGTNVQLTFVIHQQLTYAQNMSNLVHNCESCSCMNYQGNGLIEYVRMYKKYFTNGAYYCCILL